MFEKTNLSRRPRRQRARLRLERLFRRPRKRDRLLEPLSQPRTRGDSRHVCQAVPCPAARRRDHRRLVRRRKLRPHRPNVCPDEIAGRVVGTMAEGRPPRGGPRRRRGATRRISRQTVAAAGFASTARRHREHFNLPVNYPRLKRVSGVVHGGAGRVVLGADR